MSLFVALSCGAVGVKLTTLWLVGLVERDVAGSGGFAPADAYANKPAPAKTPVRAKRGKRSSGVRAERVVLAGVVSVGTVVEECRKNPIIPLFLPSNYLACCSGIIGSQN
jgi:hypothetical protein